MSIIYDAVEKLCKSSGITLAALARETGISKSTLSELKMGRSQSLSAKNLDKIAKYFGISTDYLLGNEKNPTIQDSEIKDELVAFYGDTKKDLTQADIDDIKQLIRLRAELNRNKG